MLTFIAKASNYTIRRGYAAKPQYAKNFIALTRRYGQRNLIREIQDAFDLAKHRGHNVGVSADTMSRFAAKDVFNSAELAVLWPLLHRAFMPLGMTQPRVTPKRMQRDLVEQGMPRIRGVCGSSDLFVGLDGIPRVYFIIANQARYIGRVFSQAEFSCEFMRG